MQKAQNFHSLRNRPRLHNESCDHQVFFSIPPTPSLTPLIFSITLPFRAIFSIPQRILIESLHDFSIIWSRRLRLSIQNCIRQALECECSTAVHAPWQKIHNFLLPTNFSCRLHNIISYVNLIYAHFCLCRAPRCREKILKFFLRFFFFFFIIKNRWCLLALRFRLLHSLGRCLLV